MDIAYEVDSLRRVVCVRVSGELDDAGLAEVYRRLRDDRTIEPDFAILVDLREAKGSKVTPAGVRDLARWPPVLAKEAHRAVLVPSDLGHGMARMYELTQGDHAEALRVFREPGEARRWVGLEGD